MMGFGAIFMLISGFIGYLVYGSGFGENATITVNGEYVSYEVFCSMLWPKLFIGAFFVIGLCIFCVGLRKKLRDVSTSIRGVETYGKVVDLVENGTYINDRPSYDARVIVVEDDGYVAEYNETVGFGPFSFEIGDYVAVKHHKNDINIISAVHETEVPDHIKEKIRKRRAT